MISVHGAAASARKLTSSEGPSLAGGTWQELESLARARGVRRRSPIYLPGEPARAVYLLKRGRVKISHCTQTGREVTFEILGAGQMFGELEALDGSPRESCAEALDDVELGVIPRDDFVESLSRHPGLALEVTKLLGARLRRLQHRLEGLIVRDVPARIVQALQELSGTVDGAPSPGAPICVRVTHQELANLIGCNRETVSTVLGELRRRGLVRMARQSITILDLARVSSLVP